MFKQGFCASLFWTANIILVKILLNQYDSNTLALYKSLLSSVMLFMVIKNKIIIEKKDLLIFIGAGLFSVYLNYYFSYQGMQTSNLVEISLVNALTLVVVRPKLDIFNSIVLIAFIIGINGVINKQLLFSMIAYAMGIFISRKSKCDYMIRTMFTLFFGSIFFLPKFQWINFNLIEWSLFLVISVLGYGYIMYVYMKTSEKNPYLNLHPVFTYLASIFLFDQPILVNQVTAFFLLFIDVILFGNHKDNIDKK